MSGGRAPGPRRPKGGVGVWSPRWAYFGGNTTDVARVREWSVRDALLRNGRGFWVELVFSELASNAVQHTATGEQHGRMWVGLELLSDQVVLLSVVDQGRKWGGPFSTPQLVDRQPGEMTPGGRGLWLVDRIAEYWWWEGELGMPLEMRAMVRLDREPDLGEAWYDLAS